MVKHCPEVALPVGKTYGIDIRLWDELYSLMSSAYNGNAKTARRAMIAHCVDDDEVKDSLLDRLDVMMSIFLQSVCMAGKGITAEPRIVGENEGELSTITASPAGAFHLLVDFFYQITGDQQKISQALAEIGLTDTYIKSFFKTSLSRVIEEVVLYGGNGAYADEELALLLMAILDGDNQPNGKKPSKKKVK